VDFAYTTKELIHENSAGYVYWIDDTYVYISIKDIKSLYQTETTEFIVAVSEYFDYKVPVVIDRINHYSVDEDSFKVTNELAPLCFTAIAFVGHDNQGTWANNYSRDRFSTVVPSEVFTDQHSAIEWIKKNHFCSKTEPSGKH